MRVGCKSSATRRGLRGMNCLWRPRVAVYLKRRAVRRIEGVSERHLAAFPSAEFPEGRQRACAAAHSGLERAIGLKKVGDTRTWPGGCSRGCVHPSSRVLGCSSHRVSRRREIAASPIKPVPKSSKVPGSGTWRSYQAVLYSCGVPEIPHDLAAIIDPEGLGPRSAGDIDEGEGETYGCGHSP
jgi:hypothetical protein